MKPTLTILGAFTVAYAVFVLAIVATCPDPRLRCLLDPPDPEQPGLLVRSTPGLECKGPRPQRGDYLVQFNGHRVRSFLDFAEVQLSLWNVEVPDYARYDFPEIDLATLAEFGFPPLVSHRTGRWVEIRFRSPEETETRRAMVKLQSAPTNGVLVTLVWLVLQLLTLVVAALAFWSRPFDRAVRLFYLTCALALGAFVGGFHWWIVAGGTWLVLPFVVCAVLLPVVTLHFFLVLPRPKPLLLRYPRMSLVLLYALPVGVLLLLVATIVRLGVLHEPAQAEGNPGAAGANIESLAGTLTFLRFVIRGYVVVATFYFLVSLAALLHGVLTTRNPLERSQVRWIFWAGVLATAPLGYTLYLVLFDQVGFAMGRGRVPMFAVSLCFTVAYAVAIARYKLVLVDQLVSRGAFYYVVTGALTLALAMVLALGLFGFADVVVGGAKPTATVAAILVVSVVVLVWGRDRLQQMADRRFFSEKYQLDKALRRMNRSVGHLVDRSSVAQRMVHTCREILEAEFAALYVPVKGSGEYRLVAADGDPNPPSRITVDEETLSRLRDGDLRRISAATRDNVSPVQQLLRRLQAELVHGFALEREGLGLVVLGRTRGGAPTAEDLTFLHALSQITTVALHGARVHEELVRIDQDLRSKVEQVEKQKRQIGMLEAELSSLHTEEPSATPRGPAQDDFDPGPIRGNSAAVQAVLETARKVAGSESTVLVRGESGTGKELLARVLHDNSPRRDGPLVTVHCAALSPALLESELFGHVKGAFTGAHQDRIGRFQMADGGTLFLDEIGDVSLETQVKLLRVLQERCFEPVGGSETHHVDVRLVTATHQNLERLIEEGRFREDLYYRLNVISVTLPPLRDRPEDVVDLAVHFLRRASKRQDKRVAHIDDEALEALQRYDWPGNVRELENVLERAVVLAEGETVTLEELSAEIAATPGPDAETTRDAGTWTHERPKRRRRQPVAASGSSSPAPFREDEDEREVVYDALRRAGGNKAEAARLLGMPRSTYYSKLQKFEAQSKPR